MYYISKEIFKIDVYWNIYIAQYTYYIFLSQKMRVFKKNNFYLPIFICAYVRHLVYRSQSVN